MKHTLVLFLVPALFLTGCGEGGRAADVVQAATKSATEVGQQLAAKAQELTGVTGEEARAKVQELLDMAARELKEVRDSETARKLATDVQSVLEQLGKFAQQLGTKLNLAGLRDSIQELIERFRNDPHVTSALKSLQEKLDSLTH